MYWKDLTGAVPGGPWLGLDLVVEAKDAAPRKPGWRVECASKGCIRIVSGERTVLWARVTPRYEGVWVLRADTLAPGAGPVPPITMPDVRAIAAPPRSPGWWAAWARFFARALGASPMSPLCEGRWRIASPAGAADVADSVREPLRAQSKGPLQWYSLFFDSDCSLVTLRERPPAQAARVKAWRKCARDGSLPPLLAIYVTSMTRSVLLDGRARLRAASLEGIEPPILRLIRIEELQIPEYPGRQEHRAVLARAVDRGLERQRRRGKLNVEQLNDALLSAYQDAYLRSSTRAWPIPGGERAWRREVERLLALLGAGVGREMLERVPPAAPGVSAARR